MRAEASDVAGGEVLEERKAMIRATADVDAAGRAELAAKRAKMSKLEREWEAKLRRSQREERAKRSEQARLEREARWRGEPLVKPLQLIELEPFLLRPRGDELRADLLELERGREALDLVVMCCVGLVGSPKQAAAARRILTRTLERDRSSELCGVACWLFRRHQAEPLVMPLPVRRVQ